MHQFKDEQFLPISKEKAWDFFSSPKNLSKITPPEMEFKILSQLDENGIFEGMIIDYIVRPILSIPVKWQTKICKIDSLHSFTDIQLKGPYKTWEHTHIFEEKDGGVWMMDIVNYELPFGALGRLVENLFVRRKIESIFLYRRNILNKLF